MKTGKKIIFLTVLVFIFLPVFAQAVSWLPLVPCGLSHDNPDTPQDERQPCNQCDLFRLLKNIIDFVLIGLMPPAAAILFVWGGFLILMGGANPGLITQGKTIFFNTAIGVAIISASWLITNTIIKSVANESVTNPNTPWYQFECHVTIPPQQPPPDEIKKYSCDNNNQCVSDSNGTHTTDKCDGKCVSVPVHLAITTASLPDAIQNQNYSHILTATGGTVPYVWSLSSGTLPVGLSISGSNISGTPTTTGTATFTIKAEDSSSPKQSATKTLSIVVATHGIGGTCTGVACSLQVGGTPDTLSCTPVNPGNNCSASGVNTYSSQINSGAGSLNICPGINTIKLLKSIAANESGGVCNKPSSDGLSAGFFQLKPDVANIYKARCGVTEDIDFAWLNRCDTIQQQACIAATYIATLAGSCGCDVRQLAAGYNGGGGACSVSADCGPAASSTGGQCSICSSQGRETRRWECLWDDVNHQTCNADYVGPTGLRGGYIHTRKYAPKVEYCYNNVF